MSATHVCFAPSRNGFHEDAWRMRHNITADCNATYYEALIWGDISVSQSDRQWQWQRARQYRHKLHTVDWQLALTTSCIYETMKPVLPQETRRVCRSTVIPLQSSFCIFKHNQQDATLHNGIYYSKCATCFRRFLRPSSGAIVSELEQPTIAVRMLCIQFWAPEGGWSNCLKRVEQVLATYGTRTKRGTWNDFQWHAEWIEIQ